MGGHFFISRNVAILLVLMLVLSLTYIFSISAKSNDFGNASLIAPKILRGSNNETTYFFELKKDPAGNGKNKVLFTEFLKVKTAKDLLLAIPAADAVSYYDEEQGKTIGYVSAFGGIGKNFEIIPGMVYEVSVKRDANWSVVADSP